MSILTAISRAIMCDLALFVESELQLADLFTKALGLAKFYPLLFKLNLSCHSIEFEGGVKMKSVGLPTFWWSSQRGSAPDCRCCAAIAWRRLSRWKP